MHRLSLWRIPVTGLALIFLLLTSSFPAAAAAPSSDDFDSATIIPGLPFTDALDTSEATTAADDPDCVGNGPTVWYTYTPTETVELVIDTFGSSYDTTLSVYTGPRGALTQLACNDDWGGLQSRVHFTALAGETYAIMIGAYASGPGGQLVVSADVLPAPITIELQIDPKGALDMPTGVVTLQGTLTCSRLAYVDLVAELRQRTGRFVLIDGAAYSGFPCDGATPWSVQVEGTNGPFGAGPANVAVTFAGYDPIRGETVPGEASQTVRLKPAH